MRTDMNSVPHSIARPQAPAGYGLYTHLYEFRITDERRRFFRAIEIPSALCEIVWRVCGRRLVKQDGTTYLPLREGITPKQFLELQLQLGRTPLFGMLGIVRLHGRCSQVGTDADQNDTKTALDMLTAMLSDRWPAETARAATVAFGTNSSGCIGRIGRPVDPSTTDAPLSCCATCWPSSRSSRISSLPCTAAASTFLPEST